MPNAFSELNGQLIQRERFRKQLSPRELGDDEADEYRLCRGIGIWSSSQLVV